MKHSALLLILLVFVSGCVNKFPTTKFPQYSVIESKDQIELRQYDSVVVVKVNISENRDHSVNKGMEVLSNYIFKGVVPSKNIVTVDSSQNKVKPKRLTVVMADPVKREYFGKESWDISFIMSEENSIKSLPKPENKSIKLIETEPYKAAIIRFFGNSKESNLVKYGDILEKYLGKKQLKVSSDDPIVHIHRRLPWSLWLLESNELIYIIKN